jgi:Uma2 family endonuclease
LTLGPIPAERLSDARGRDGAKAPWARPLPEDRPESGYNVGARPTMAVQLTRRRFTVDEYYWMARVGILAPDDRVELIDGEIVEMAPIGPVHAASVRQCTERFGREYSDLAQVSVQSPIRLGEHNEPEPDLALVRRRADFYRLAHPTPEDVFLVVEVADTSLAVDRRVKLPLYARAGIPETWLVDLQHDVLLVHREPTPDGYRVTRTARRGERIAPLAFPDREIAIADLLG